MRDPVFLRTLRLRLLRVALGTAAAAAAPCALTQAAHRFAGRPLLDPADSAGVTLTFAVVAAMVATFALARAVRGAERCRERESDAVASRQHPAG